LVQLSDHDPASSTTNSLRPFIRPNDHPACKRFESARMPITMHTVSSPDDTTIQCTVYFTVKVAMQDCKSHLGRTASLSFEFFEWATRYSQALFPLKSKKRNLHLFEDSRRIVQSILSIDLFLHSNQQVEQHLHEPAIPASMRFELRRRQKERNSVRKSKKGRIRTSQKPSIQHARWR
jgi:hypothetical protein